MNDIRIRKATLDDIKIISKIKIEGWQSAYKNIISDEYLNNMDIDKIIAKNIKKFDMCVFVVAEIDDKIVGFSSYNLENDEDLEENADCELIGIYVNPKMKRKGIGRKLIDYIREELRKANKQKMILWCLKENYPSRKFYKSMGGVEGKCKKSRIRQQRIRNNFIFI